MTRGLVHVRDATSADAPALQSIWLDFAGEYERNHRDQASLDQIVRSVLRFETDPSERLLVATVDGSAVGVAHLRRAAVSPLHDDDAVHVGYLHVLSDYRRRGIGRQLLEAAADWADEKDAKHVVASVAAAARDANRFLARLGLGQVAVVRASTVVALRSKLGHVGSAIPGRVVSSNIVATRRLMRRSRARV
jgi:GNAT superfamily N-acetyltransferase